MIIQGVYYKTILKNVLTGKTDFFIIPSGRTNINTQNGLLKCTGNIGVFVKNMPIEMDGNLNGDTFIVNSYKIPSHTKENVDKILTWIDESIAPSLKDAIAKATNNDLIGFVKNKNKKEKLLSQIIPKNFKEDYENGTLKKETILKYYKAKELVNIIYERIDILINQEKLVKELLKYGVDIGKIETLCKKNIDMEKIKRNPYNLLLKFDIPISVAEAIFFQNEKANPYDIRRLCGYLYDAMSIARDNGNTCLNIDDLLSTINYRMKIFSPSNSKDIEMSISLFNLCMNEMMDIFCYYTTDNKLYVYFNEILKEENMIVENLQRLKNTKKDISITKSISEIEETLNITYNKGQRDAFSLTKSSGVKILTGPPGSGKTATINGLIEYYGENGKVMLAATTGMAAKVMTDSCKKESHTVNQMLGLSYFDTSSAEKGINNPIDADFIIIDECSMLGTKLFSSLLKAIKSGSILLLVGDEDQLQSVEYGNILHDLIKSDSIEVYRLTEILRQSGTICENASKVNKGNLNLTDDETFKIYSYNNDGDAIKDLLNVRKVYKSIILTPTKLYKNYGTRYLNSLLQDKKGEILISYGDLDFRMYDKVVMTRNNYESDYINGDLGQIVGFENGMLIVEFTNKTLNISQSDLQDMDLAYSLTVHKAQGSEFDDVYILLQDKAKNMTTRRLLYTAITRAKKHVYIYNVNNALQSAIENKSEQKRTTNLEYFCKNQKI